MRMFGSFSLYFTQHSCEAVRIVKSGTLGFVTSHTYDSVGMPSGCFWNSMMLYAMASLRAPSGYQEM